MAGSNVSKDLYSPAKRYYEVVFSKKRPILDLELNELQKIERGLREQTLRAALKDGPYGDAFLVEGTGNPNEIRVRSGLIVHEGFNVYSLEDEIIGGLTTPPIGTRTDYVYVEYYLEEVDSSIDAQLIGEDVGIETAVRNRLVVEAHVAEGGFIPTPALGHKQFILARINRNNVDTILTSAHIQDLRAISGENYLTNNGKIFNPLNLNLEFEGAQGFVAGSFFSLPASSTSIGSNETRCFYIAENKTLVSAATFPTTYHVPLYRITSNNTEVTSIEDVRRFVPVAGSGSGSSQSVFNMLALSNLQAYQLVRVAGVNTVDLTDASSESFMPAWGMTLDAANAGSQTRVTVSGIVNNTNWSFTPGVQLYGSETSGEITENAPSNVGSVIQKVGIALSPTQVWFNPDLTYDVVGGIASHAQNTDIGTTSESFTLRLGLGAQANPAGVYVNRGLSPQVGIRYTGSLWEFTNDGSTWEQLGAAGTAFRHNAVGDGLQTVFTMPQAYTVGGQHLLVFSGTTLMTPGTDYTETNSTTITFNVAPLDGQVLSFIVPNTGNTVIDSTVTHAYDKFTGDGVTDTFALSNLPVPASVIAVVNGVTLTPDDDYTVTGSSVEFSTIPPALDKITIFYVHN